MNQSARIDRTILLFLGVLMLGNALDAYAILSVPISWIAAIGQIALFGIILLTRPLSRFPTGTTPLLLLVIWALAITSVHVAIGGFSSMLPQGATCSYFMYLMLRFLNVASVLSVLYVTYYLLRCGGKQQLLRLLVCLGMIITLASIYIYLAQTLGLPAPSRTRLGTGGGFSDVIRFTYAFHRALGTFREPSHLAEWLFVPLAASILLNRGLLNVGSLVMGGVLLLTGSMTGIIGFGVGFAGSLLITRPRWRLATRWLGHLALFSVIAGVLFSGLAVANEGGTTNLLAVISERISEAVTKGLGGTNRAYVYEFVRSTGIPLFGYGLGHGNILLSQFLGAHLVVSLLNLYLFFALSTGLIGGALLLWWLVGPILRILRLRWRTQLGPDLTWILLGYIAWLVAFSMRAEELQPMFAVILAFLAFEIQQERERRELQAST